MEGSEKLKKKKKKKKKRFEIKFQFLSIHTSKEPKSRNQIILASASWYKSFVLHPRCNKYDHIIRAYKEHQKKDRMFWFVCFFPNFMVVTSKGIIIDH